MLTHSFPTRRSSYLGEASRVAIARAILFKPEVLLLDEPFKNLDISLKYNILLKLKELLVKYNIGVIYVTHDVEEALNIANRIIVFSNKPISINLDLDMGSNIDRASNSIKVNDSREQFYNALVK